MPAKKTDIHDTQVLTDRPASPTFSELTSAFARIGVLSFGGPAAQIALMHKICVEEKRWIDEDRYLHALNYCMLLPGPEAQQLATYIGWLLHGRPGSGRDDTRTARLGSLLCRLSRRL